MNNSKLLLEDYKTSKNELETQERKYFLKLVMTIASGIFLQIGKDAEKNGILLEIKETTKEIRLYKKRKDILNFTLGDSQYAFWNEYHDIIKKSMFELPTIDMAYYTLRREGNLYLKLTKDYEWIVKKIEQ